MTPQQRSPTRRHLLGAVARLAAGSTAVAAVGLAGCGRKPAFVDPPPDLAVDTYPRSYPPADSPAGGLIAEPEDDGRRSYPPL